MPHLPHLPQKPTRSWWAGPRELLRLVIGLDDTPHNIALGAAIGMFVGWTPTVGLQMVIVLAIAFLARPFFRFNQFAGLVMVYVSNPLTTVPMYWLMYRVGTFFVPGRATYAQFAAVLKYESWSGWLETLRELFVVIGLPLVVGSLVLATLFGLLTYPVMRYFLSPRRKPAASPDPATEPIIEPAGDEATGDEATGDEATGDEATGDEATGDAATGEASVEIEHPTRQSHRSRKNSSSVTEDSTV